MIEYYWSAKKGKFLYKETGEEIPKTSFHGDQHEWNEHLTDILFDMRNNLVRHNFINKNDDLIGLFGSNCYKVISSSVLYEDDSIRLTFNEDWSIYIVKVLETDDTEIRIIDLTGKNLGLITIFDIEETK